MKINNLKKIFGIIILIILTFSILLNVFLAVNLKKYYSQLYAVELDPLGLSKFQQNDHQATQQPVIVFFGDSRAAQWQNPPLDDYIFINRGIGNQTSSQVANRFDAHVKSLEPDVVIIQVCINDLKTIPLFPGRKQEIILNCETNIQKIIQDSLEIEALVIVTTVFPPTEKVPLARQIVWSDEIYKAVNEVNAFILGLSSEKVIVFDAAIILSNNEEKTKPEYSYDLLHLNYAGYQALNLELVKVIEQIK
jgi:lysophospholipase L1-like esterase